jgi:hypothetical protein
MNNNVNEIYFRNPSSVPFGDSPLKELENYIKSLGKELAVIENKKNNEKQFEENLQKILKSSPQKAKNKNVNKSQSQVFEQQLRLSQTNLSQSLDINKNSTLEYKKLKLIPTSLDKKNLTIYDKNFNKEMIKERKLELLRERKVKIEMSSLKNKADISQTSLKIINTKLKNVKPIYERSFEIIEKKQEKVAKMRSCSNESKKDCILRSSKYDRFKFENWLKSNDNWNHKKHHKILVTKELQDQVFENNMKTFYKPRINTVSKAKTFSDSNCFDRLYNYQEKLVEKMNSLSKKYAPSFAPKLIKRNKNFISLKKGENLKEGKEIF